MARMTLQKVLVLLCAVACQLADVNCDVTDNMADAYGDEADDNNMARLFAEMYYKDLTNNLNQEAYAPTWSDLPEETDRYSWSNQILTPNKRQTRKTYWAKHAVRYATYHRRKGPRFVGRRRHPMFIGKRDVPSPALLYGKDYFSLQADPGLSRSYPYHLLTKRSASSQPEVSPQLGSNSPSPLFIGKGSAPALVGNLDSEDDDEKRARFFVGKKSTEDTSDSEKRANRFVGKRANRFVGKRANRFVGKREDTMQDLLRELEQKRARFFVGKRPRMFVGKRDDEEDIKRANMFVGKRLSDEEPLLEADYKRPRMFVGKRSQDYAKRPRMFVGKRDDESDEKRARYFIGKREDDEEAKRARYFIGKREEDQTDKRGGYFVGKRDSVADLEKRPRMFVGKRGDLDEKRAPMFPGKIDYDHNLDLKRANRFVGKREHEAVEIDKYADVLDNELPNSDVNDWAKRARYFIGKRDDGSLDGQQADASEDGLDKRARYFIGKRDDDIEQDKRTRYFIGKREFPSTVELDDELNADKRANRFVGKRPRMFVGKRSSEPPAKRELVSHDLAKSNAVKDSGAADNSISQHSESN